MNWGLGEGCGYASGGNSIGGRVEAGYGYGCGGWWW